MFAVNKQISYIIETFFLISALILVLAAPNTVINGVGKGLVICAETILPVLFLFMLISSFLADSKAADIISLPLLPLTKYLLRIPQNLGCMVLLSMLGGYPIGAKIISQLYNEEKISKRQVEHLLCFCCNPSPAFAISAVGVKLMGDVSCGIVIYVSALLSALLIGAVLSENNHQTAVEYSTEFKCVPFSSRVIIAMNNTISATVVMCGFVLLFSAFTEFLNLINPIVWTLAPYGEYIKYLIYGITEVTVGCMECSAASIDVQLILMPFLTAFSGCSVMFQVMAMFKSKSDISFKPFITSRFAHGILTTMISFPFLKRKFAVASVLKMYSAPVPAVSENSLFIVLFACGMCCMLFLKAAQLQLDAKNLL